MSGIMNIGLRSLMAFQSAIQTTAQNLQNARTPFYSRRQINLVSSMFEGGIEIKDIRRVFDDTANNNLLRNSSAYADSDIYYRNLGEFEKLLDGDATSINKYINDSLSSLQELTRDTSSTQMRGAYLSRLTSIAGQLKSVGAEIARRKSELNQNIDSSAKEANDILAQIAAINDKINQTPPAERVNMLDQRNALVHELSQYLNFNTSTDANGNLSVTLSNGLELVTGSTVHQLSASLDPIDGTKLKLMLDVGSGNKAEVGNYITSGQLNGLMRVRSEAYDAAENGLSRLALTLASAFNNQNKLGIDNYGKLGGNIFTDINDPALAGNRVMASSTNTGSGNISVAINTPGQLINSDYQLVFSDATHYSLKRKSDNTVVSSGNITSYPATIQADGFTATISSGTFNAGDVFDIKPTNGALAGIQVLMTDPGKLALGYPVSASASTNNAGQGKITVDSILNTSNSAFSTPGQLNPPIKIVFLSDNSYQIVNATTNAVMEGPITYDSAVNNSIFPTPGGYDPGYRVTLTGTVKQGDTFNIDYNSSPIGDNRNAQQFINLYTNKLVDNGRMTLGEAYHHTASDISMKTSFARGDFESATILFKQAENRYNQVSGVSDMEEMSNLSEYQQSYQACAQVVQVARTIFDTIIGLTR